MRVVDIENAVKLLNNHHLVIFPTETVYGLGAIYNDEKAIARIFQVKGRPINNPLIVHISSKEMLKKLTYQLNALEKKLIAKYWPGPLTIVVPALKTVSRSVTAGLNTVAIRMPNNNIALDLIRNLGEPIAAPSANPSGKPSPTSFKHIKKYYQNSEIAVIKGNKCTHGLESTVVMVKNNTIKVLRLGAISILELKKAFPRVNVDVATTEKERSPGNKYKHYAPDAEVILFSNIEKLKELISVKSTNKTGILASKNIIEAISRHLKYRKYRVGNLSKEGKIYMFPVTTNNNSKQWKRYLYAGLIALDEKADLIYAQIPSNTDSGIEIIERLNKASTK